MKKREEDRRGDDMHLIYMIHGMHAPIYTIHGMYPPYDTRHIPTMYSPH
jgi:hypothetical protein